MKKLDPDLVKWLLEWTAAALIVTLVVWWVWTRMLGPSHTTQMWRIQASQVKDMDSPQPKVGPHPALRATFPRKREKELSPK